MFHFFRGLPLITSTFITWTPIVTYQLLLSVIIYYELGEVFLR